MDKQTIVIISGHFNPLHVGHLDMIEDGKSRGDILYVIVNNDEQQLLKKGKIISGQDDRMRIVKAIGAVDEVVLAVDKDLPIVETLKELFPKLRDKYPNARIIFGNGGSDRSNHEEVPESAVCKEYDIEMQFDVGGNIKSDSSTRINTELGH